MTQKNKIIFILSFLFIIIYNNIKADNKDSIDIKKKNICIIKHVPTDLVSIDGMTLGYTKLSVEVDIPLSSNIYLGTKLSKVISLGDNTGGDIGIPSKSTNGYQLELNGKYFLFKLKNNKKPYTGCYVSTAATYLNTITVRFENIDINEYKVYRDIFTYKLLFGYQTLSKHKIIIDQSIGIGVSYSNSHSINKIYKRTDGYHFDDEHKKLVAINYSLKIGLTLNKKFKK